MSLYIPDLANDEFGPFVQGLADNFNLLEGSLVEYGSNSNGEYWRWECGLQICCRATMHDMTKVYAVYSYPAAFVDSPDGAGHSVVRGTATAETVERMSKTYCAARKTHWQFHSAVTDVGEEVRLALFAVGRWK